MTAKGITGTVAAAYCDKFPEASTVGLAKLLRHEQPEVFHSVEHARGAVRKLRGEANVRGDSLPPQEETDGQ